MSQVITTVSYSKGRRSESLFEIREERGLYTVYKLSNRSEIGRGGMALRSFKTRELAEVYVDNR